MADPEAVRARDDEIFWTDFHGACRALTAAPQACAELREEDAAWEATVGDGLDEVRPSPERTESPDQPGRG